VREGRGGREAEVEEGHRAGQHGGGADLRGERDTQQEPGAEFSADELAGGRGVAAGAERRGDQEGDAEHGRRGRQHGGRYEVDEFGAGGLLDCFIGRLADRDV